MKISNHSPLPELATWPVFCTIVALLVGALVLDIALSAHWTDPFMESGTWVLIGVVVGLMLRGLGAWRAQRGGRGEEWLRRASLVVWGVAALGGLISLL